VWLAPSGALALAFAFAFAGTMAGCSLLPSQTPVPVDQLPVGIQVRTPDDRLRLEMNNGTTLPVSLSVNGGAGRVHAPGQKADLGKAELGSLLWHATVRTPSGRQLPELTVESGDVWVLKDGGGQTSESGPAARVDLSCGRIDMWSGIQPGWPAPGPGTPGDCAR
jgi:hypothetical protein